MIIKFRIILDTEQDVFRDIEIDSAQNLLHLHHGIKKAFELEGEEMASFYQTDENWIEGDEIPLEDMSENQDAKTMEATVLEDFATERGAKLIYVYDFLNLWTFFCEVVETEVKSAQSTYPVVVYNYGIRPDEKGNSSMFDDLDFGEDDGDFDDDDFNDGFGFGDESYGETDMW